MSEASQSDQAAVAAAFVEHLHAFHASLPAEEQALLEQVFQLAARSASGQDDTAGHLNYTKITFGSLTVDLPQAEPYFNPKELSLDKKVPWER